MSERKGFDLGDYVEVKDRIAVLYELYPQARIVTEPPILTSEPDGKPRVVSRALVYRTPDDPYPSAGTSWLELPGTTPYTKGSEAENAETSAVGRAIGFLGILIDKSIASRQEVENKAGETSRPDAGGATEELLGVESAQGVVKLGSSEAYKLESRETPDGMAFGFRLDMANGKAIPQVVVMGEAAIAALLATQNDPKILLDQHVRVKGKLYAVRASGRRAFNRLKATEIVTSTWAYPESPSDDPPSDPPESGAAVPAPSPAPTTTVPTKEAAADVPAEPVGAAESTGVGDAAPPVCGSDSPYGDGATCTLLADHKGPHKNLEAVFPTTWDAR